MFSFHFEFYQFIIPPWFQSIADLLLVKVYVMFKSMLNSDNGTVLFPFN